VRTDLDFHVRTHHVHFDVEVFQQQHKAKVGILQFVLITRVTSYTSSVPRVTSKADQ
jgi:hypothetical protein